MEDLVNLIPEIMENIRTRQRIVRPMNPTNMGDPIDQFQALREMRDREAAAYSQIMSIDNSSYEGRKRINDDNPDFQGAMGGRGNVTAPGTLDQMPGTTPSPNPNTSDDRKYVAPPSSNNRPLI